MRPAHHHSLLADPTRRAILTELRAAGGPLDVRTLSTRVGLKRNSVRDQLRRLEAAGLVRSWTAAPNGRGRPRHLYVAGETEQDDPHRVLTAVLADELAARPDAAALAEAAGDRWGRSAARAARERDTPGHDMSAAPDGAARGRGRRPPPPPDPLRTLVEMLGGAGFEPDPPDGGDELRLRACPFLPLEPRHLPIVCGVHLGFIRGALAELGSTARAVAIEPFVEPGLCVARLASR